MFKRTKQLFFIAIIGFSTTIYALQQKRFVIIITSFNNAEWYRANLASVFDQEYDNYRVIYVDDCSDDGTAELVEKYIAERGQEYRCILIKNKQRVRALANLYNAVHMCDDDEIIFNFDGDDWFAHNQVFAMINDIYHDPHVWITYGQFKNWPTEQLGYCKALPDDIVKKQLYRQKWWAPGQLRTFYAWLFKKIQLKDLLFEGPYFRGQFFPANADLAIYYPMMEMAGHRHKFISDIIYIRNVQTPINDFKANKDVQIMGSALIRAKKKYPLLPNDFQYKKQIDNAKSDIVIISEKGIASLLTTLNSIYQLAHNINRVYVCYDQEKHAIYSSCPDLKRPEIILCPYNEDCNLLKDQIGEYVLLLNDSMVLSKYINLRDCIHDLERTGSLGYYLTHNRSCDYSYKTGKKQPVPLLNKLTEDLYAWAFHYADWGDWRMPFHFGALYRKKDFLHNASHLSNPIEINEYGELENIGLCPSSPKIVCIQN